MAAPKLITITPEGSERYIAVDSQGRVWRGRMEPSRGGSRFIKWEHIDQEFPREAS